MATYLSVPCKKTWEVDLVRPLKTFISSTYGDNNESENNKAIQEFNKLRSNMISKMADKHDSALEVLYRYYDQLKAIEGKVPISENGVRVSFKWQDAFGKEGFFGGKKTLTIASAAYEEVCVLFNIAALQSQIAEIQSTESDEGLKTAAKLFQQSSGIFGHLKDIVLSHVQNEPTQDLLPDTLGALSALMLAQAQDCFCRKAINDKMKPAIVAKLCHQASDFYAEAMKLLQLQSIRDIWPRDWVGSSAGKQAGYHALAEFHQAQLAQSTKEFGEEISRLRRAKELMAAADTRASGAFIFGNEQKKILRQLEQANKDNDLIYHARIPDISSLSSIGKVAPAKSLPPGDQLSSNFQDLFGKVVPLSVHQALQFSESRKAEIVNMEVGRLRETTQLLNSILASLNLPAAIEDLSGTKVPSSVLEKAAKLREMGGADHLTRLMSELPELLTRNKQILDEGVRMLDEEEASDKQHRAQFKEKWTRTPSEKLTEPIRIEAAKYDSIIDNAVKADSIVQQKYQSHRPGIEILSKSDADVESWLPSGNSVAALQGSPVIANLRKLMEEVETIKAEREVIENEIKEAKCDLTSRFMTALAQDGAVSEEAISASELDRIYTPLRQQVSESLQRQEHIVNQTQSVNAEFVRAKSQNQSGASREEKLKELAAAYDGYVELKGNLEEGTKFYNDLTQLLVKFQTKVSDLCFARKTEKEELMRDLQRSIANQPSGAAPAQPSYHQPTEATSSGQDQQAKSQPPARPPPPKPNRSAPAPPNQQNSPVQPSAAVSTPNAPAAPASAPQPYAGSQPFSYHQGAPSSAPSQQPYSQSQLPYPTYNTPYPVYPSGGYVPPPMPQGYNPYAAYNPGYPQPQPQPYPQQQPYPGYPGYPPQQQWR